jgi:hypothetical protein
MDQEEVMSTYTEKMSGTSSWPMYAVVGAGLAAVLTAAGTFVDLTDNEDGGGSIGEYLVVIGIIAVATAAVFGLVVRTTSPDRAATRALVLAVVGLLSAAVFWTGLPAVLAAGSLACATTSRDDTGRMPRMTIAAVAISLLTIGLAVLAAIAG